MTWAEAVTIAQLDLTFNDDVNEDLINLHHHRTPFEVMPSLVQNYRMQARTDGAWVDLMAVDSNRTRHHRHVLAQAVHTDAVRLIVDATNGDPSARVMSVRANQEPTTRVQ